MDEGADPANRTKADEVMDIESGSPNQMSDPGQVRKDNTPELGSQSKAKDAMQETQPEPTATQQETSSDTKMEDGQHDIVDDVTLSETVPPATDDRKEQDDLGVGIEAVAENGETTTINPTESTQSDSPSSSMPKDDNACPEPDLITDIGDDEPIKPIRRSARARKAVNRYEDGEFQPPSSAVSGTRKISISTRPKRKAAEMASKKMEPETLKASLAQLEHALSAMQPGERREFAGWVEIESEPAFFNAMLQSFGAPSFQIRELWGLDPEALAYLPRPVHGLIFLYQYNEDDEDEDIAEKREECPDGLWFGNQTTTNACATVAIMNILMNAADPGFGPELTEFKAATANLPPPHRGHMLDTNDFIRGIHNSAARRIDLLSEDLLLDNKFEEWEKEQNRKALSATKKKSASRKTSGNGNKKKPPRKKKRDLDIANHYIAYVPMGGRVWELDGLEAKPLCHGTYSNPESAEGGSEDNELMQPWLHIALSAIAARMEASADAQLNFNLLAVCNAPLVSDPDDKGGHAGDNGVASGAEENGEKRNPTPEEQDIIDIRQEAMTKMESRRLDYTPAIHAFVVKLAEMGLLRDALKD
ncbi:Ubiquitin carboxyl-terminal hydrolase 2 [Apiospora marii]|uniref:Ubiquitin carboxyl-terminal hydrolase n=1 Tax=Apiospora marii TaxID=335849 RepID=A0ABR1RH18_9PEZI